MSSRIGVLRAILAYLTLTGVTVISLMGCVPTDPKDMERLRELRNEQQKLRTEIRALAEDKTCSENAQCQAKVFGACTHETVYYSNYSGKEPEILKRTAQVTELWREEMRLTAEGFACPMDYPRIPEFECKESQCVEIPMDWGCAPRLEGGFDPLTDPDSPVEHPVGPPYCGSAE